MEWSNSVTWFAAAALLTVVTVDVIRRIPRNHIENKGCPLPPGPTVLPFVGSSLSLNAKRMWLILTEWRAKYGRCSAECRCAPLSVYR